MKYISLVFIYILFQTAQSQDLLNDVASSAQLGEETQIFTEQIRIIAHSKKVFILTNTNGLLNKGDFITLIINDKDAVARAVVAKNHNSLVGIKILKIYSIKNWSQITKGMDIKILKGDDSILFVKEEVKPEQVNEESKIKGEEDLYAEELALDESITDEGFENQKRHIKPDNIVGFAYSRYTFKDDSVRNAPDGFGGNQITASWAYQFQDNVWIEGLLGTVLIENYPDLGDETRVIPLIGRLKYTFKAPLYSYIMPYIGFQANTVISPNAQSDSEKRRLADLTANQVVFGVTLLRRLVPGWFLKADIGSDTISIGAAVEF